MKTENELIVLEQVLNETIRFEEKLKTLIKELKLKILKRQSIFNVNRSPVKRSALDLKKELSKITTATGVSGKLYYKNLNE